MEYTKIDTRRHREAHMYTLTHKHTCEHTCTHAHRDRHRQLHSLSIIVGLAAAWASDNDLHSGALLAQEGRVDPSSLLQSGWHQRLLCEVRCKEQSWAQLVSESNSHPIAIAQETKSGAQVPASISSSPGYRVTPRLLLSCWRVSWIQVSSFG